MHFLLTFLLLAAAVTINNVSCLTVCYPSDCNSYTAPQPGTVGGQKTTWSELIGLDKFDNQGGSRTLKKVTIKTIFRFESSISITCKNTETFCNNEYGGAASPGVEFKMDLESNPGVLPEYWGRWGDYPYIAQGGSYASPGIPPNPDTTMDYTTPGSPVPMFVEYTYPLFDIRGFTPSKQSFPATCSSSCSVWGYYTQTAGGAASFLYGTNTQGKIVGYEQNLNSNKGGYNQFDNSDAEYIYSFGKDVYGPDPEADTGIATPANTEVFLGSSVYDIATTPNPIVKSISDSDPPGGVGQNISPSTVLAYFQSPTSGSQIQFRADATGFVQVKEEGGNTVSAQNTTAYVQMAIVYEYQAATTQQDPQFVGFHGQSFQVHGYPGSYFHLISAPSFQMNGRFTYLANGHCNYKHTPCWTHPGTYIDDVTFIVDELLVRITAGPVGTGYSVRINDEPFHAHSHGINETDHTDIREFVPTKFYDAATHLTIHLRSSLQISIRTSLFAFTLHNADHFFNIDSQLLVRPILAAGRQVSSRYPHPTTGKPWFPEYPIHGFIGQTWANATYAHHKLYQGDVDDYVETRPYSTDSIYSQYNKHFDDKNMHWE